MPRAPKHALPRKTRKAIKRQETFQIKKAKAASENAREDQIKHEQETMKTPPKLSRKDIKKLRDKE